MPHKLITSLDENTVTMWSFCYNVVIWLCAAERWPFLCTFIMGSLLTKLVDLPLIRHLVFSISEKKKMLKSLWLRHLDWMFLIRKTHMTTRRWFECQKTLIFLASIFFFLIQNIKRFSHQTQHHSRTLYVCFRGW